MTRKYKSFPLVCVEWEDHSGDGGWVEEDEMSEDIKEWVTTKTKQLLSPKNVKKNLRG